MKSPEKINELIEKAISKNPKIGYQEGQLFFFPTGWISLNTFIYYFIILSFIPVFFYLVYFSNNKTEVFATSLMIYTLAIIYVFIFFSFITYNYSFFDFNKRRFYTLSKLFNKYRFWKSYEYKMESIKNIYLESKYIYGERTKTLYDFFGFVTQKGLEITLSERNSPLDHDLFVERGQLIAACLGVRFITKGNKDALEELERLKKIGKKECPLGFKIFLLFCLISFFIILIMLIYYLKYII